MRRVSIANLLEGMVLAQPVYSSTGAMLIPGKMVIADHHIKNLKNRGVSEVWIEDPRMDGVIIQDAVSDHIKIKALQTVRSLYQKAKKNRDAREVAIPDAIISGIASDLLDDIVAAKGKVLNTFYPAASSEDYLPVHTVNVTMLAMTIGRQMGLNDMALFDLGIGALLYDLGMAFLPDDLIIGKGHFTDEEFNELKNHTVYGFSALQKNTAISATAQSIALQHHEKFDGTGYPKGLLGADIHQFARIISVADVYDSLLSDRPYRKRFQPHQAYEYIMTAGGFDFDLDVIQAFTMCIAPYQLGSMVMLNTGEKGVISKVTWGLATRPTIRVFYNAKGEDVTTKLDIDLACKPSVLIDEIMDN